MENQIKSKRLHITLWVVQVILALAFGMVGIMKMYKPADQLIEMGMTFVKHFELSTIRFIGIAEILGAIGLILPAAIRIKPILTPIAAIGIALVMILASAQHISRNESFVPTVVLFALAVFIAWGRLLKVPIQPR